MNNGINTNLSDLVKGVKYTSNTDTTNITSPFPGLTVDNKNTKKYNAGNVDEMFLKPESSTTGTTAMSGNNPTTVETGDNLASMSGKVNIDPDHYGEKFNEINGKSVSDLKNDYDHMVTDLIEKYTDLGFYYNENITIDQMLIKVYPESSTAEYYKAELKALENIYFQKSGEIIELEVKIPLGINADPPFTDANGVKIHIQSKDRYLDYLKTHPDIHGSDTDTYDYYKGICEYYNDYSIQEYYNEYVDEITIKYLELGLPYSEELTVDEMISVIKQDYPDLYVTSNINAISSYIAALKNSWENSDEKLEYNNSTAMNSGSYKVYDSDGKLKATYENREAYINHLKINSNLNSSSTTSSGSSNSGMNASKESDAPINDSNLSAGVSEELSNTLKESMDKVNEMNTNNATKAYSNSGTIDPNSIDYSRISTNAEDALKGDFINESNVKTEYFKDGGNITYQVRDDGSVLIFKDGVAMGYTDKENLEGALGNGEIE